MRWVGLSEVSAQDIRRAHAVVPISAVEQEWSLFTRDIEVRAGSRSWGCSLLGMGCSSLAVELGEFVSAFNDCCASKLRRWKW